MGAFGKQLREVTNDQDNNVVFDTGWRGKEPIIKLSLSTLGTVGNVGATYAEGTKSTKGKNQSENSHIGQHEATVAEDSHLTQITIAIESLFEDCPDYQINPDPVAIALDLFFSGYLGFLPEELEVEEALSSQLSEQEESIM